LARPAQQGPAQATTADLLERSVPGQPHKGKVLLAVQAHADDVPLEAEGTVAKLIEEGYTGYLVRATNDDMGDAPGLGTPGTIGENVLGNERDNAKVAEILGCEKHFDLNYSNHRMADVALNELICRLIFLVRLLKVDTVIGWDPHDEENPDHVCGPQQFLPAFQWVECCKRELFSIRAGLPNYAETCRSAGTLEVFPSLWRLEDKLRHSTVHRNAHQAVGFLVEHPSAIGAGARKADFRTCNQRLGCVLVDRLFENGHGPLRFDPNNTALLSGVQVVGMSYTSPSVERLGAFMPVPPAASSPR
jgi:hypothetical protein